MRQMTIFDYLKERTLIGNILDPKELGQKLTFLELEAMIGTTIAINERNKKSQSYRAVKVLKVVPPDKECNCRRLLYDNGNHTCVVVPESSYADSVYAID